MSYAIGTVFTEGLHRGEYIKSEANSGRSRDAVVIAGGSGVVQPGTVLGQQTLGAPGAGVAGAGNHGNGTIGAIGAIALGPLAKAGTYQVEFTGATTFNVLNPGGRPLTAGAAPDAWGAAQAGPEIFFAFTAGSTPMQAGDSFTIAVAAGTGKYVPCVATALDGSQVAAAIAYAWSDTTAGDVAATVTARDSEVFALRLTWDPSISGPAVPAAALAAAMAQLQRKGIILR